jgi:Bacteriophage head to tail connecting protein.
LLENEWKEIRSYLAPDTGCFDDPTSSSAIKKDAFYKQNVNTLPSFFFYNLAVALVMNLTPSRLHWFRLSVPEKTWEEAAFLKHAEDVMLRVFSKAGVYDHLMNLFLEAPLYGCSVLGMNKDAEYGVDLIPTTIGEFWMAEDYRGTVNCIYRKFAMTAINMSMQFGYDNLPEAVKKSIDNDDNEAEYTVIHAVEQNPRYNSKNPFNKEFISVYYCEEAKADEGFLEYKTTSKFPYVVSRWDRYGKNPYGFGIGRRVLGDVKSLQAYEKDLAKASKKKISPPLKGSTDLQNKPIDISAEKITFTNDTAGLTPLFNVNYETREAIENIQRIVDRLYKMTYNDLFLAILNKDKTMSATEAAAIVKEKEALGAIVERFQREALKPLIENTFLYLLELNQLGEVPSTLSGKDMTVEYQSVLSSTQEIGDLQNIDRYLSFVSQVATVNPDAARKPDVLAICDYYADRLNVDFSLIKTNNQVENEKEEQAEAEAKIAQQQFQLEQAQVQAAAVKDYAAAGKDLRSI